MFFLDPDGKYVDKHSLLAVWYGRTGLTGQKLFTYLVRNLGYASCEERPFGYIVTYNAQAISRFSVAALCYWFADRALRPQQRVAFVENFRDVSLRCGERDVMRFLEDLGMRTPEGQHPRFYRKRIKVGTLECHDKFKWILTACQGANTSLEELRPTISTGFDDRYLLIEADRETGRLRTTDIGGGYPALQAQWRRSENSVAFGQFSDPAYQAFALEAYRRAAKNSQSAFIERIDATIHYAGSPPVWINYDRLILSLGDRGAKRRLLSVSLINKRVVMGS